MLSNETNITFVANPLLLEYLKKSEESENDYEVKDTIMYLLLIFSYSLIFFVSSIGNTFVCKVIFERETSLTLTDTLIGNLAISDLLMTLVNIPFNIFRFVLDNWPFGQTLCILVPFIQSMSVHCSSITMMFIAIERYRILGPHLHTTHIFGLSHRKFLVLTVLLIWLLSALFSLPHGMYNKVVEYNKFRDLIRCRVTYPEPTDVFRRRLTIISFLSQYLIPVLLTRLCYLRIALFLWQRKIIGVISENQRITIVSLNRRRIKMLALVVTVFAICWLPLNIYHLLTDFDVINYSFYMFFLTHWFAMSSIW